MSTPQDQIVFEDLHGVQKDKPVTVDLDADLKDEGIQRTPDAQSADAGGQDDDSITIDGLRPDDQEPGVKDAKNDAASKDSEDDDYSKKVKARIERERRAKAKERDRADYWEQQARKLAKDQHERDKKTLESDIEQTDSAIEQTLSQIESAIEDGNTKEQVRLTDALTSLKAKKAKAEFGLENLSESGNEDPFDGKFEPSKSKGPSRADQWIADRSDWYRQPGFEKATRLANKIDREIAKEGEYTIDSPDYFRELDRRIKEEMPDLYDDVLKADDKDDDSRDKRPSRSPVAPVDGAEDRHSARRSSEVKLDAEDFEVMREFGLDPNDPKVLKEFALNKREIEGRG